MENFILSYWVFERDGRMFGRVKNNYRKTILPLSILSLLLCVLMLALSGFRFVDIFRNPAHLNDIAVEDLNGSYAFINVSDIEGTFARYGAVTAEGGTDVDIVKRYCIFKLDEDKYMGIAIKGKRLADVDKLGNAIETFGETQARTMDFGTMTGTVRPMNDELYDLFCGWAKEIILTEPSVIQSPFTTGSEEDTPEQEQYYQEHILPLILQVDYMGAYSNTMVYVLFILGVLFLLAAVVLILTMVFGVWDKPVRKLAFDVDAKVLEKDFSEGKSVGNAIHIGHEYIWWFKRVKTDVIKTPNVIWAYPRSKRLEGGKFRWSIVLKTEDKREYSIVLGESEKVQEALEAIEAEGYLVGIGFDKQKQQLYDKDISTFKGRIKKERKDKEAAKQKAQEEKEQDPDTSEET